ncbi:hypothetical protein [Rhodanobacter hydrolyticus]|uniref:Uncharacterized protein n=1 Tax=Rhodanobacter hydrolyticus TaxID=2250595 RepID=A0ABW8J6R6_9GAMM
MTGRTASAEREGSIRYGHRLRWTRVATLAAVVLIHLCFLAFLLAPPPGPRWPAAETLTASADALVVRLLPSRKPPAEPPQTAAMPRLPRSTHAADYLARHPMPVPTTRSATLASPPPPSAMPHPIDRLIVATPPSYIAGGGRLSEAEYGQQNIRVPNGDQPVHGTPVFRMADPRMQGIAGVVRFVGSQFGAIDPHCLKLDAESNMSIRERVANHVDADDAQMAASAERYGCPDPLKPGAPMYYSRH